MNDILKVKVISPRRTVFEGEALSVSSQNSAGNFDILPDHANFVTMVEGKAIIIRLPQNRRLVFSFPVAIIYNAENTVKIFTDIQLHE